MERIITKTDDGTATLFIPELQEHYHSVKGARTESKHIFLNTGLEACATPAPHVLEIGFGTGLNAWLTLERAEQKQRNIHYTSIERYPLAWSLIEQLHYTENSHFKAIHQAEWNKDVQLTPHFIINKIEADVNAYPWPEYQFDVIYFDAFAPEKQPEMWSELLFKQLYNALKANGILTTYCAKGCVRRLLQSIGFKVERLPGPPGGKREILRATKVPL